MTRNSILKRPMFFALAAVLLLASIVPVLVRNMASAYTLPDHREIKMDSSKASNTGTTYNVSWYSNSGSTYTIKGIVVDFCEETPIIGDTTCTKPTGFSIASNSVSTVSGISGGTWTSGATVANSNRTLILTDSSGNSLTSGGQGGGGTQVNFTINNVTNPSTSNHTYYARIYAYSTTTDATNYTPSAIGTPTEAGGIALSTADQITVQSKVQERLTFCVYTSAIQANCTGTSTTNPVVLGDATTGVLDPGHSYTNTDAKYDVATNASNGVTIRAKGTTLTSGSFTIDAVGATAAASSVGGEQFGLCTYRASGGGAGASTTLTPASPYNSGNCSSVTTGMDAAGSATFAYDVTTSNNNFLSTYGATIANKTAGDFSTGVLAFLGNISNTTEPGIYTSTLTFIATGNY